MKNIACPVYGFYGENDERVNATIPKAEELMKAAGKKYEPVIYKGAGHGFMRSGEPSNPAVREADQESARRSLGALEEAAEATAIGRDRLTRRVGSRAMSRLLARSSTCVVDAFQFVDERLRIVHFSKRLDDRGGINRDGARLRVRVNAIGHE